MNNCSCPTTGKGTHYSFDYHCRAEQARIVWKRDSVLMNSERYTKKIEEIRKEFWRGQPEKRRGILMPFVWNQIVKAGQIHGN